MVNRSRENSASPERRRRKSRSASDSSRSASRSVSRSHSKSRSRSRSRGRRSPIGEGTRVHIANLTLDHRERDIEKAFEKFGPISEVWMAHSPPCFGFVVYKHKEDAEEAIKQMDGSKFFDQRLGVSLAKPRRRPGLGGGGYSGSMGGRFTDTRCFTCGEDGHFARDCEYVHRGRGRYGGGGGFGGGGGRYGGGGGGGGYGRDRYDRRDDYYDRDYDRRRSPRRRSRSHDRR